MKPLFIFSSLLLNVFVLQSQNQKSLPDVSLPGSKTEYITNAGYLFGAQAVSLNASGDSLIGFKEAAIKNDLLLKGLETTEMQMHLKELKRRFIREKYYKTTETGSGFVSNGKTIGTPATVNFSPCINEGFESTLTGTYTTGNAVNGWSITSRGADSQCNPTNWNSGSNAFAIVSTPILSFPNVGSIPNSPLGGTNVARLNNFSAGDFDMTRLSQTFPVTTSNNLFQFAFAGYWVDGGSGHGCCDQPYFKVLVTPCGGTVSSVCSSIDLGFLQGCGNVVPTFSVINGLIYWTNWQTRLIDLTPYIGTCVTIDVIAADCSFGGHEGVVLFDASCGSQQSGNGLPGWVTYPANNPVSYCAGSGYATLQAPTGYTSYSWTPPFGHPTIPASQATLSTLTTSNAVAGSVFTVNMTTASGCIFSYSMSIAPTTVSISAIGTSPTCSLVSTGSATIIGNGSGSGYNYVWLNSTGSVVSTAATATALPFGVYMASVSAIGNATCGSATSTVSVGLKTTTASSALAVYCLLQPANLFAPTAGGNFQWYDNFVSISGGTLSNLTVNSPSVGAIYRLSYVTNLGCRDSIVFSLSQAQPGGLGTTSSLMACQNGTNGSLTLTLTPAIGASTGYNTFYVANSNSATPSYSLVSNIGSSYSLTAPGLITGGNYFATAFDGACYYSYNFSLTPYVYSYTLNAPSSSTLCTSNILYSDVTIQGLNTSYTYSWSPNIYLPFSNTTNTLLVVNPSTLALGTQTTITYSVIVTPTVINCPETKTFNVTFANPFAPNVLPISALCDNDPSYTISVFPANSVFSNNSGVSSNGIITPSLTVPGVNSYTVSNSSGTCVAQSSGTFMVLNSPTLQVSGNTTVCKGQSTTLLAQGAGIYSWNGGSTGPVYTSSPSMDTTYSVIGNNSFGCYAILNVPIHVTPLPTLSLVADTVICPGESTILFATGADSYNWNGNVNSSTVSVSPTVNTTYTVTGINNPGSCASTAAINVTVIDCIDTGIEELLAENGIRVYPNPSSGTLFIESGDSNEILLSDLSGKIIYSQKLESGAHSLDLSSLANGYYLLKVKNDKAVNTYKILKNN